MTDASPNLLAIGLGVPGPTTAGSRRSAGYMALNLFASGQRLTSRTQSATSSIVAGDLLGKGVILAWPLTFMKDSGRAAKELVERFEVKDRSGILILHDEPGSPVGSLELEIGGEACAHEGFKAVRDAIGPDLAHLTIGIGSPPDGEDPEEFLLSPFDFDEQDIVRPALARASKAVLMWMTNGFLDAKRLLAG
jgi:PTH1 family peptidyl-tRNA hydrolase